MFSLCAASHRVHPAPPPAPQPASTAAPARPARHVQVSHLAPAHNALTYRRLLGLTLASGVSGAAAMAPWITTSVLPAESLDDPVSQGTMGGVAALGGVLLGTFIPLAAAKAWQWGRLHAERARVRDAEVTAQLDRLVEVALQCAPLTDEGLQTAWRDINTLRWYAGSEVSSRQASQAIARLAGAALTPTPCRNPREQAASQLGVLCEHLAGLRSWGRISNDDLREALLTMSDALSLDAMGRHFVAEVRMQLVQAFVDAQAAPHSRQRERERERERKAFEAQLDARMQQRAVPELHALPVVVEEARPITEAGDAAAPVTLHVQNVLPRPLKD